MVAPILSNDLDRINRHAYGRGGALREAGSASGWLDAGEQAAAAIVADTARDQPILDIGVGGGRTTPLMRAISADYRGIDYVPEMVATARRRFPEADFREMDARKLDFPDHRFALVTFSYNGIDSVDFAGQRLILAEVHRVLRPDGRFVFSALNRDGDEARAHWPNWQVFHGAGARPDRMVRAVVKFAVGGVNHLHGWWLSHDDGDVAIGNLSAHNFALVTAFPSVAAQFRQLHASGFAVDAVFAPDGSRLSPHPAQESHASWHHFVARKMA